MLSTSNQGELEKTVRRTPVGLQLGLLQYISGSALFSAGLNSDWGEYIRLITISLWW